MLVALLSYYREPDRFLKNCIRSLALVGVDKLIALDGAYALYPGGSASSPVSNHRTIEKTCRQAGIESHHFVPEQVWAGNEIEKRTALFDLAEQVTGERDWYFVVDGDEVVTDGLRDLPNHLASKDALAATADLWMPGESARTRMFFRALRGLKPVGNHGTYALPDGRVVWGPYKNETEPAVDLDVRVRHLTKDRPDDRKQAGLGYYDARDRAGVETARCAWCGSETTTMIPFGWWRVNGGMGVRAKRAGVCPAHFDNRLRESVQQAADLGFDARPYLGDLVQIAA